ncbi:MULTISPECIES: GerAB/ArcD/ProY family transporter [Bacillus cereus group]|uniref:GerAB/ArcD/ProY family transporter n=1 Tax=Bacillus cereus group TaxID=86661 RepID=UPI000CD933BC|nr:MULTISPECIES: endospore germination permease [Bacillus cereus group]MBG9826526.1 spore gernimation protein KC [Bacillus wiedmannii]UOB98470.1 spore germination protein [Bacillus wiedmannii]
MNSHIISIKQLFCLMILFQLGSIGVNFGGHLGKDAWISLAVGVIEGSVLFIVYCLLHKQYPTFTYVQLIQHLLGKWLGIPICLLYSGYFMYIGSRIVRDFTEILSLHILYITPAWCIASVLLLVVGYAGYKGLQTTARVGMIGLKIFFILWFLFVIGIFVSHLFHMSNLQPIAPTKWRPIFQNVLPLTIPYGGMITFLMLFAYTSQKDEIFKNGLWSIFISGFLLVSTTVLNIGVLGGLISQEISFPMLTTSSLIKIGDFIQRLEPISIILLIIGSFFKIFIFHYTACLSLDQIFQCERTVSIPIVSGLMIVLSIFGASNNITHLYIGFQFITYYIHIPLQIIFPTCLLCISIFSNKKDA